MSLKKMEVYFFLFILLFVYKALFQRDEQILKMKIFFLIKYQRIKAAIIPLKILAMKNPLGLE